MFAGGGAPGQINAKFHERTEQRYFQSARLDLKVRVGDLQLLAHHLSGRLGRIGAVGLEVGDQVRHCHLVEHVDAHAERFRLVRVDPVQVDLVGHVGCQAAYRGHVD